MTIEDKIIKQKQQKETDQNREMRCWVGKGFY